MSPEARAQLGDLLVSIFEDAAGDVAQIVASRITVPEPVVDHSMTAEEVGQFLSVGVNRVMELARSGALPHRKSGRRFIFRRQDVEAWEERDLIRGGPRPLGRRVG